MTEQHSTPEPDTVDSVAASPAAETARRPRGTILALLVALLALAGTGAASVVGWYHLKTLAMRLHAFEDGTSERLDRLAPLEAVTTLRKELETLRQALEAQQRLTQDAASRFDALRSELASQQQALDALRALAGRDERLWRLGEIEHLLTAAQTRLRLLDDAATARLLLQEADRTAAALGGEALPLREAIQQAAAGILGPTLDREGLALRLTQLAEVLPDLPRARPATANGEPPPDAGWWPRLTAWMGQWLHIERTTTPTAERDTTLVEAANKLLQARRALLARDTAKARELTGQAAESARSRLDGHDPRALAALDELSDILTALGQPTPAAVDLTPAFTALRALRAAGPSLPTQGG